MSVGTARAATLNVNCAGKDGLNSIGAALKVLQHTEDHGRSTINVSGACHENILIQNMDELTLNGVNGASITDAANGAADVVDVDHSSVTLSGLTINGGYDGVACYYGSYCHLIRNTIQGAADSGVLIYELTRAQFDGGVLQHNAEGLAVAGGDITANSLTVQQNSYIGVGVSEGGRLRFQRSVSANNQSYGIWVQSGNVVCAGCSVNGNQWGGVYMELGASVMFFGYVAPVTVTGNTGIAVFVGDAAAANFQGTVNVTGTNGQSAIFCNSVTSITHGAIAAAGGQANTNCKN